jgi:hypothetical protein
MSAARQGQAAALAAQLLDAHVAYWLARLEDPAALEAWLGAELDALLADAGQLKLKDVVSPAQIKATARTYAIDLSLQGGIPELVTHIAGALYRSPAHAQTRVVDVLPDTQFLHLLDKALELESFRARLIRGVVASPFYISLASDLLYRGIRDYVAQAGMAQKIPGAGSMMKLGKSVISRATPRLEASVEQSLRKYIARSVEATAVQSAELLLRQLDRDSLRGMALEVWQAVKHQPLSTFKQDLSELDVEELFVLGYSSWGELRKTRYYATLIETGIDAFFAHYGRQPLTQLLEDLGITRQMMLTEALRYTPTVVKALQRKKLLEPLIRRQLAGFYTSDAVRQILGG